MSWKRAILKLLGRDGEPVVVCFLSGPEPLGRAMVDEVRGLVPDIPILAVGGYDIPGLARVSPDGLRVALRGKRVALAPVLFTKDRAYRPLRRLATRVAPHKLLAFNERLERHHLSLSTFIASWLFLSGVALDRIWLRPRWWPLAGEPSAPSFGHEHYEGRAFSPSRPRIAILSPYFPYPLSHGGAVRIFHMIREAARDHDVLLFSFAEKTTPEHRAVMLELCAHLVLFPWPRYREPRWASLDPPEVREFKSAHVAAVLAEYRQKYNFELLQVEYTHLAGYGADVLVEHDVTFDLQQQIHARERSLSSWWNWWRWRRYERRQIARYRRVAVMSEKDAELIGEAAHIRVVPNGVDLERFRPAPEADGLRLLFVGSFRHFPNVVAYRFFVSQVWPLVSARLPGTELTVVDGPDAQLYEPEPPPDPRIRRLGFVRDVHPLYVEANLVIVPTQVSAGTNLKVLEAMAMERAVVSTTSGCAGLGLHHGTSVWIADSAQGFADAIERLLKEPELRRAMAAAARTHAEERFDWRAIGAMQSSLWAELLHPPEIRIRPAGLSDVESIAAIQSACAEASHWEPESYFIYDFRVAEAAGGVAGFMVSRQVADETEILNLAVAPQCRRRGVATALIGSLDGRTVFLEVRASNLIAQQLYAKLGFTAAGRRKDYYDDPVEDAIVMRAFRPC